MGGSRRAVPALCGVFCAIAVAGSAPVVRADTPIAVTPGPTGVAAYGGVVMWSQYDPASGRYALWQRTRDGRVRPTGVPTSTAPFDVTLGPDTRNRVVALYPRCREAPSASLNVANGCDAYRLQLTSGREAKLSFSSPDIDEAWPAQWRDTFVFGRSVVSGPATQRQRCDVPYRRSLSGGPSKRMDRGRCAQITGMALRGTVVAQTALSVSPRTVKQSQVRLLSTRGGPVTVAAEQGFGEEAKLLGGPALDADHVYATRHGLVRLQGLIRIRRSGLRLEEVPARLTLAGPIAHDEGTLSYVESMASASRVIRSPVSPFSAGSRVLPEQLRLRGQAGQDLHGTPVVGAGFVPAAAPFPLAGSLTRTVVSRGIVTATRPVAGRGIELLTTSGAELLKPEPAYRPAGLTATSASDGSFAMTVPPPIPPVARYQARTAGTLPALSQELLANGRPAITLSPSATSVSSGAPVTFTGTLDPPQPGRGDIVIQFLAARNTALVPPMDTWETVATATTSPDGRTFTATTAITRSGIYTAVLPFIAGFETYNGRSPEIAIAIAP